jgi:membrane fusion protein, multidrug efflux system
MGRLAAMLIIAMAGALALAGCNIGGLTATAEGDGDANGDEDRETLAIPVEVELPHRSDISAYFETTTRVEAEHRIEVMAEAVGRASSIHVDEGDIVNQGDILAELDKREAESSLRQTEVQLRQHRTELDRARRGYELGIIPRAEYESARFAYEQSLASLESQRIQLDHLTVRAPIAGVVTELHARTGSMISSGSPLCTIVDPNSYRLVINPPERELGSH